MHVMMLFFGKFLLKKIFFLRLFGLNGEKVIFGCCCDRIALATEGVYPITLATEGVYSIALATGP